MKQFCYVKYMSVKFFYKTTISSVQKWSWSQLLDSPKGTCMSLRWSHESTRLMWWRGCSYMYFNKNGECCVNFINFCTTSFQLCVTMCNYGVYPSSVHLHLLCALPVVAILIVSDVRFNAACVGYDVKTTLQVAPPERRLHLEVIPIRRYRWRSATVQLKWILRNKERQ